MVTPATLGSATVTADGAVSWRGSIYGVDTTGHAVGSVVAVSVQGGRLRLEGSGGSAPVERELVWRQDGEPPALEGDVWVRPLAGVDVTPAGVLTPANWTFAGLGYALPAGTFTGTADGLQVNWNAASSGTEAFPCHALQPFVDGHRYRVTAVTWTAAGGPATRLLWGFTKGGPWKAADSHDVTHVLEFVWRTGGNVWLGIGGTAGVGGATLIRSFVVEDITSSGGSEAQIYDSESGWILLPGGVPGPPGAAGPAGPAGPTGPTGPAGAGVTYTRQRVSVPAWAAGGQGSLAVTFTAGFFTATPTVVVTPFNGNALYAVAVLNITTTGCTLVARQTAGAAAGPLFVELLAIQ